jgi:hypothetical protein
MLIATCLDHLAMYRSFSLAFIISFIGTVRFLKISAQHPCYLAFLDGELVTFPATMVFQGHDFRSSAFCPTVNAKYIVETPKIVPVSTVLQVSRPEA